ncbi:type IIL restriction-modification enzyme MmeI [Novosphingobium sp. Chol11]|uniref:type IIL restriction-modification enzyme MmeI n=1 Tax=Novosphingobium sp. Chol11 TaxID=1385763 RepID=UPI0025DF38F8|nr:type IIL restriction-modification enzyme MmeI [Novosphingobium sp. Chol11]
MEVAAFIAKWLGVKGGAERANYAQFINDLCGALDLPVPEPAESGVLGSYQFEGPVPGGGAGGNTGAIDLYKRGCFILEAKQSRLPEANRSQAQLFDIAETAPASPSGARYDKFMRDALAQAKRYAVNLPGNHPWPPFLIVCDVGRSFELYFDWSGSGRGYGHFPDQHSYRFELHRFAEAEVQALFRAVWTKPDSIDPRARSADVSRSVARRLADVSKWLEETQRIRTTQASDSERSLAIEETALFLMRIVFCMFAEDVGLLPPKSFTAFLEKAVENEAAFQPELRQLWSVMGRAGGERYASAIGGDVRYFNGGLFATAQTYNLSNSDRGELLEAAKADWTKVEPAIFGTLLEQALTSSERAKLGAHYTPRPYVERLVQATIMDVSIPSGTPFSTPPIKRPSLWRRAKPFTAASPPCAFSIPPAAPAISSMSPWKT